MKRSLIFQIELPSLSAADSISLIVLFQANRIWGRPHIFYSAACSGANISIRKKSRSVKYKNCAQRSRSSVAWRMNLETWGSFIVTSMEAGKIHQESLKSKNWWKVGKNWKSKSSDKGEKERALVRLLASGFRCSGHGGNFVFRRRPRWKANF